jgi:hypothetical protein
MTDEKIIQHLQDRFDLSKAKASVIYFKLQEHFTKDGKGNQRKLDESLELP